MSQAGYTPIQLYYSATAAATPSAGNLAAGELAVNITDGKLFYKDNGGVVRVLATAAGAAGDVVGPGSSTDNALVRFDGTTGKLVQSSVGVLDDSGNLTGIAALTTSGALTLNGGTANGVTYLNGSKVLTTGSALVFDGTNLGVGVTPSAWSTLRGFDIGTTGSLSSHSSGATDSAFVSGNAYFNGTNWIYKATSTATQYKMYGGVHSWYTAPSGTAGNAISFTQAMTLDVSGNLGIGTSSPTSKLVVGDNATTTAKPTVAITDTTSGASITLRGQSPILSFDVTSAGVPKILMDGAGIEFKTGTLDAQGDVDLKIDSSGNVGIGTSSPGSLLQVEGAISMRGVADVRLTLGSAGSVNANTSNYIRAATDLLIYNTASGRHSWEIGGTERMRLDSSGNLLLNTTSSRTGVNSISIEPSGNNYIEFRKSGSGSATQIQFNRNTDTTPTSAGSIATTGTTTTYNTSSDYRLKDVTGALTGYKERLMSLQPKQGTWVVDGSEFRGFLAHEFANPYRASVTGEKDAIDETGNPIYQGMQASSSEVMADLVALVQEQQAIIIALTARVAALESN